MKKHQLKKYHLLLTIFAIIIICQKISGQNTDVNELRVSGTGELLQGELIDNSVLDANSKVCAGLIIESNLSGLDYESNNGIIKIFRRHDLNPKLVMAVIHTESAFNPRARSTFSFNGGKIGHAYGLMQLVPHSGGKEAYNRLGKSGQPSPTYLYDVNNNIELETIYLNLLSTKYFRSVNDQLKNQYLITCAYNAGSENVARDLIGTKNVDSAIQKANGIDAKSLYNHLVKNLPHKETQDYIQKVVNHMPLY